VRGLSDAAAALRKIAQTDSVFASRGDDSGTHKKELSLWHASGLDPARAKAGWYRETGSGMGATLNTASAMDAYVLSDWGTWVAFANKGGLEILVQGGPRLLNPYGVVLVNPARHPHVNAQAGQAFIDWLISDAGQRAIASFRVDGEQLFFPDAR
ncbi:MAG: substrate-binding domain-containing protein, partial [Kiloniellales bacterium]